MNKNTEQRGDVTIQPLAGAPGAPSATPNYLEEFPAEANNATTKYNDKNAIWDSGNEMSRYKHVSFAGNGGGFQLRADTALMKSPAGAPGRPTKNDIFVRVKNLNQPDYFPWVRLYHTGNLDPSKFLTTANLNAKADKTYVDSALASKLDASDISSKAEKTYVDNALATKAEKTTVDAKADRKYVDEGLKTKINYDTVANEFTDVWNNIQALNSHITGINNRLSNLESKH